MKEGSERIVGSPETIFSFFELLLSSPPITLQCVRFRSQGAHKTYRGYRFGYSLKGRPGPYPDQRSGWTSLRRP